MSHVIQFIGGLLIAFPLLYIMKKAGIGGDGWSWLRVMLASSMVVGVGLTAWAVGQR